MSKRYQWLDILRGLAIVSVYLVHSILVYPIDLSSNKILSGISQAIVPFYMPLFFLIAGYCFKEKPYLINVKERCKRLIIPYFAFNILTTIVKNLGGSLVNTKENPISDIVGWFLYGGHYWFLYVLFIISLLMPLTKGITENVQKTVIGCVSIIILGMLVEGIEIFCVGKVCWYYLFYVLGAAIKKWKIIERLLETKIKVTWIFLLAYGIGIVLKGNNDIDNYFLDIVLALVGSSICWRFAVFWEKKQGIIKNFFVLAGKYSLQFYVINGYLLVCARVFFISILHLKNEYIIYIAIVLSNLIGALIAVKIIEKIKPLRVVFGMREAY